MPHSLRLCLLATVLAAAAPPPDALQSEIPDTFTRATDSFDFVKREAMVPMRDGVHLKVVILLPRGAAHAPMLLERTPYDAQKGGARNESPHLVSVLRPGDDIVGLSGYIRVFEDVRGKHGSEGGYVMNRPVRGPLNPTQTDHPTDTYDTIDWLVKNVPESNGRVGTIGTSYDGFTTLMSTIDPHPALKVAVPIAPMVDGWMGDDWFHHGAFRQEMIDYIYDQEATTRSEENWWSGYQDDYSEFLDGVSADGVARAHGLEQLGFWQKLEAHPAYDGFWQGQAVDKLLGARPIRVPMLLVDGLWDQEDIYGAPAVFAALAPHDPDGKMIHLAMGPWRHGGSNGNGSALGAITFDGDTGLWFRRTVLQPFLDQYLKDGAPPAEVPRVLAYETGTNTWRHYDAWPRSCATGCPVASRPLYLLPGASLGFDKPADPAHAYDEYVSDPAHPVPYRPRPDRPTYAKDSTWPQWLVDDQRNVATRTDVLTYTSARLTGPLRISGTPIAHLFASTSGTDADWVVKLIDLYPDEVPAQPAMGGYQLMVSADILRGRYRTDPAHPQPIEAGKVLAYTLPLPNANHVFLPGHRVMVQIQSSWFPLYDRNPQSFVPNIFLAKATDFRSAEQRIYHGADAASFIDLPVN